jgi:HEAT repeat protein
VLGSGADVTVLMLVLSVIAAAQVIFLVGFVTMLRVRRDRAATPGEGASPHSRSLDDLAASPHWWRRARAARLAGDVARLGDRELLDRLLDDPHPAVQSAATAGVAPLADPALVGRLLDRLPERSMLVRLQQFGILKASLPATVPALRQRLVPDASPRRLKSWIALAEWIGDAELFTHVASLHSHADPLIRLSVARALRRHETPEAAEILLIALHDHDWRVRAVAARSLGSLGHVSAVPRLAAGLRDVRWWVRFRCGLALARLGGQGRDALDDARRDVDRYAGEMATMIGGLSPDSVVELAEG